MKHERLNLNGLWILRHGPQQERAARMDAPAVPAEWKSIPAQVPGNVELDLIRANELPAELDRGNNIYRLRELENHQWWYSRTFDIPEATVDDRCELVLEGVDTLATVWLNGERISTLENMLVPHRLDVTGRLKPGENSLEIGIDSTVLAAREYPVNPGELAMENNWESLWIRKAPHGFGWNIMPRAVSAGLWRDVYLETLPETRFRSVYAATMSVDVEKRSAYLWLNWDIQSMQWPVDDWIVRMTISSEDGQHRVKQEDFPVLCMAACQRLEIRDIDLWWPKGFGKASLYHIRLELLTGDGRLLAEEEIRHGFRTVKLERTDTTTANGDGEFVFIVNGEKIFIKGTNWVPLDAFHSRDAGRLDETLDMVCDLNCNMIRCWGGNVYEDQAFFDRCDEEGLMVWQDFAFACAFYPQAPEFYEKVRHEAETLIPLLRNHPSLALWAGNNEVDYSYGVALPEVDPNIADRISRDILATACRQFDPLRDYLPSSPYFSPALWAAGCGDDRRPEDHLWPRGDFKGPYYLSSGAHFVSEFGYYGCPGRESLEKMMTPENLWPWQENDEWLTHIVRPQSRSTEFNERLPQFADQIAILFGEVAENLDDFASASQISQAEALKFLIEHFRIGKWRRTGILWWNVRDGWPQISDGIVDYYGVKKAAYGVIRRIQQDVCVMLDEPADGMHRVVAVNDTLDPVALSTEVSNNGEPMLAGDFTVPANGRLVLGTVPAASAQAFYTIKWIYAEKLFRNHYLAGPRPFDLAQCRQWYAEEGLVGNANYACLSSHSGNKTASLGFGNAKNN